MWEYKEGNVANSRLSAGGNIRESSVSCVGRSISTGKHANLLALALESVFWKVIARGSYYHGIVYNEFGTIEKCSQVPCSALVVVVGFIIFLFLWSLF
jgi:hypothetical protein